ncbi:MAG: DUF937 domain-containing protein, partial [Cyanobacteria bacterium P01_D01_bin.44]
SLLPAQAQQQIAQTVAQQAGLNAGTVQGMLPTLLPAVMGLLNMGSSKPGKMSGMNPLLTAFLGGNKGGNDLGNVMKFASRFLQPS